jgi:hypothetical protein
MLFAVLAFALAHEQLAFEPLRPSVGPMLILTTMESERVNLDPCSRRVNWERHWAYDPQSASAPQEYGIALHNFAHPRVYRRVDHDRVLVELYGAANLWRMSTGEVEPLAPSVGFSRVVDARGGRAYFVADSLMAPRVEHFFVRDLCADGVSRRVSDLAFSRLLSLGAEGGYFVTASSSPRLVHLEFDGELTDLGAWDASWGLDTLLVEAPGGRRIAIDIGASLYDSPDRRLVVIDAATGASEFRADDLVGRPWFETNWSTIRSLQMKWLTPSRLQGWELTQQFELDLTTGEFSSQPHALPPRMRDVLEKHLSTDLDGGCCRAPRGSYFECGHNCLYITGAEEPLASVSGPVHVSDDGRWAAYVSTEPHSAYVVDGLTGRSQKILDGAPFHMAWLTDAAGSID